MKSSIWILNSALLILCVFTFGFIYFSQQEIPTRTRLTSRKHVEAPKSQLAPVESARIYENDLFGTYIAPHIIQPEVPISKLPVLPVAPSLPIISRAPVGPPQFLSPLPLTLAGIFTDNDESRSRAIIINNQTKTQKSYKIGDTIEDAELVRIFDTNVLFIRSNGQEETLFINQRAAQRDPSFTSTNSWDGIILKENDTTYYINPTAFVEKIPHLAQFLEALDANAVYKKGQVFGIKLGRFSPESIGSALGLQPGDIILSINNISTADTADRVEIYNIIRHTPANGTVSVKLMRNNQDLQYSYIFRTLEKISVPSIDSQASGAIVTPGTAPSQTINSMPNISQNNAIMAHASRGNINHEKRILAQTQANFAPRIQQVQKRNKQAMMRKNNYRGLIQAVPS